MKRIILLACLIVISISANSQILTPVKWSYAAKKTSSTEAVIYLKATLDKGWHIYSQHMEEGGPVRTSFTFNPSSAYTLIGKTMEPKPITVFEKVFDMKVSYFDNQVIFQQKIKLKSAQTVVKGKLKYMVCNDEQCLPPTDVEFNIPVK